MRVTARIYWTIAVAVMLSLCTFKPALAHEDYTNSYLIDLIEVRANLPSGNLTKAAGQPATFTGYCKSTITPMNSGGVATDYGYCAYSVVTTPGFTDYEVTGTNWAANTFTWPISVTVTVPSGTSYYGCVTHSFTGGDIEVTDHHTITGL